MNCKKHLIGPFFLLLALLLPAGSFADSRFPLPDAPLLEAIRKDDAPGVQSLLEAPGGRELVNRPGARGDRPLAKTARLWTADGKREKERLCSKQRGRDMQTSFNT